MARTDPAYLFHIPAALKKALHKEAAKCKPEKSLAQYLLYLIDTHPERAKGRK